MRRRREVYYFYIDFPPFFLFKSPRFYELKLLKKQTFKNKKFNFKYHKRFFFNENSERSKSKIYFTSNLNLHLFEIFIASIDRSGWK